MTKTHTMTSKTTGKVYEVRKMRTEESFWLSTYHYRRAGDWQWQSLGGLDTLAQCRAELHA